MANKSNSKISIVIPVYGSEQILEELFSQVDLVMQAKGWEYELIFVCDQSPDGSWAVIKNMAKKYPRVIGILLRINAGQHNALMAGLAQSSGDIIVTMDDDLQHSPKDIPLLVEKINQGSDVAYAHFKSRKHPLWKIFGSRFNNAIASRLMNKPNQLYLSPFRAMNSSIRDELLRYKGPYVYIDGLILSVTRNIASFEVVHQERHEGEGYYGFKKSLSLWMKMATGSSIIPLRITSLVGLIFSCFGFGMAMYFIILKFTDSSIPIGWASTIVTILFIGGIQLVALGVIGEYLGRALLTLNAQPQYVIAEKTIENNP